MSLDMDTQQVKWTYRTESSSVFEPSVGFRSLVFMEKVNGECLANALAFSDGEPVWKTPVSSCRQLKRPMVTTSWVYFIQNGQLHVIDRITGSELDVNQLVGDDGETFSNVHHLWLDDSQLVLYQSRGKQWALSSYR